VLIGANGAGKSNLVSFFALLPASLDAKLDAYVGRHGGPNALLHFGVQRTRLRQGVECGDAAGAVSILQPIAESPPIAESAQGSFAASLLLALCEKSTGDGGQGTRWRQRARAIQSGERHPIILPWTVTAARRVLERRCDGDGAKPDAL
jgi:hypothetical protein